MVTRMSQLALVLLLSLSSLSCQNNTTISNVLRADIQCVGRLDNTENRPDVPEDTLVVHCFSPGQFYVMGQVQRPGVYDLDGPGIALKQALTAAGSIGCYWPKSTVLTRRLENGQEQIILLDVVAIFRNEAPNIILKPDDVIEVGALVCWRRMSPKELQEA